MAQDVNTWLHLSPPRHPPDGLLDHLLSQWPSLLVADHPRTLETPRRIENLSEVSAPKNRVKAFESSRWFIGR